MDEGVKVAREAVIQAYRSLDRARARARTEKSGRLRAQMVAAAGRALVEARIRLADVEGSDVDPLVRALWEQEIREADEQVLDEVNDG